MGPINYMQQVQQPFTAALQGFQGGLAINQAQAAQAQNALALQQKEAAFARQQQMQAELSTLSRDPSPQAIAALSVRYPELSEQFKRSYDMMAPEAQRADLQQMSQVYAAVQGGRADIAADILRQRAAALRNSNASPQLVQAAETAAKWAQQHPESFKASTGLMLASALGPEKFTATFETLGKEARADELQPHKVAEAQADAGIKTAQAAAAPRRQQLENTNLQSQIDERAARLGLDRDRLTSETQTKLTELLQKGGEIKDDARKLVNENVVAATASEQAAGQMDDLAREFDALGGGYGKFGGAAEAWARLTGNQDAMTRARQEYVRLRNGAAVKSLPPGPATDKDIELAMKGFPPETADSAHVAQFLRGMAKLQRLDAAASNARAEWVGAVGHLGKPKSDIDIGGIKVPAGTTFPEFLRQYGERKAGELVAPKAPPPPQRSYMRHAVPAGGQ